jgi:hypothetical protein
MIISMLYHKVLLNFDRNIHLYSHFQQFLYSSTVGQKYYLYYVLEFYLRTCVREDKSGSFRAWALGRLARILEGDLYNTVLPDSLSADGCLIL